MFGSFVKNIALFGAIGFISCSNEEGGGVVVPNPSEPDVVQEWDFSRAATVNEKLGRGVNFGNAFDAQCRPGVNGNGGGCNYPEYPYESAMSRAKWDDCWGNPIQDDYYNIIKNSGFQSIRLPVRWAEKASDVHPFTIPAAFTQSVKAVVNKAIAAGLPVVLNIHHYNELYDDCTSRNDFELQKKKFVELWRQIAKEFKDYSNDNLVFEILNEPRGRVNSNVMNNLLKEVWPIIRETNPNRTIMINGTNNWGAYSTLTYIKIPNNDPNVIFSGHYYSPHEFSHQGEKPQYPVGAKWGTQSDKDKMQQEISKTYNELKAKYVGIDGGTIPINIGEFGTVNRATLSERAAYTAALRQEFEKYGFSWHYWAFPYAGRFDSYNYGTKTWIPEIKNALIP